jgi:hypothetical protein
MKRTLFISFALLFVAFGTMSIFAQDVKHPPTTAATGFPEHVVHQTKVKNAEVIHVSGHQIVVELENGGFELLNLPKDFLFDIDGRHLTVHQLEPGMKLSQEIHTVTTPQEVTSVRTIEGTVWHVAGPHVILSFPNGENKSYTAREGTVFKINGEDKTVFDLRKGMKISATIVTVEPQTLVSTHTVVTGQAPPKPEVAFEGPLLIERVPEEPAIAKTTEPAAPVTEELPKTASYLPLIGLLGLLLLACYAGLKLSGKKTL